MKDLINKIDDLLIQAIARDHNFSHRCIRSARELLTDLKNEIISINVNTNKIEFTHCDYFVSGYLNEYDHLSEKITKSHFELVVTIIIKPGIHNTIREYIEHYYRNNSFEIHNIVKLEEHN